MNMSKLVFDDIELFISLLPMALRCFCAICSAIWSKDILMNSSLYFDPSSGETQAYCFGCPLKRQKGNDSIGTLLSDFC